MLTLFSGENTIVMNSANIPSKVLMST